MFGIGSTELLVILLVGLIVLGPKSLAGLSRTLGKIVGEFRRVSTDFQRTLNAETAQEEEAQKAASMTREELQTKQAEDAAQKERETRLEERKAQALAKAHALAKAQAAPEEKAATSPLEEALAKAHAEAMAFESKQAGDKPKT